MKKSILILFLFSFCFGQNSVPKELRNYKIAYNVLFDKSNDNYEIFVMDPDGSGQKNISNWKGVDWVYTSFGNRIYFVSDRDTAHRKYFLYEMDADGNNVRRVSNFLVADSWQGVRMNGKEFVVSSNKDHRRNELYRIDKNGNELHRLTHYPEDDTTAFIHSYYSGPPFWESNRNFISYISNQQSKSSIFLIKPDGTGSRRLTKDTTLNEGWHS